jgi:hypothetical protein
MLIYKIKCLTHLLCNSSVIKGHNPFEKTRFRGKQVHSSTARYRSKAPQSSSPASRKKCRYSNLSEFSLECDYRYHFVDNKKFFFIYLVAAGGINVDGDMRSIEVFFHY